ncbi:hypothetical protein [Falsirhodobacter halotolerans]|uniref:hypothetical protein n=1 Tax=Falsirhodobacter halotolerans TaxID=1146892 RepID=UPI001FD42C8F|nr:hypothetical protein [Falsirhodobacter halotolerans]MCJ8138573.1 hypothetical protein [Falsirhodobacter halotolerans]
MAAPALTALSNAICITAILLVIAWAAWICLSPATAMQAVGLIPPHMEQPQ